MMLYPGEVGVCSEQLYAWAPPQQIRDALPNLRLVFETASPYSSGYGFDQALARGDEAEQVGAILGVRVEMRLQIVELGQHELVVRVAPGRVQMQPDELEGGPHFRHLAVVVREHQP